MKKIPSFIWWDFFLPNKKGNKKKKKCKTLKIITN